MQLPFLLIVYGLGLHNLSHSHLIECLCLLAIHFQVIQWSMEQEQQPATSSIFLSHSGMSPVFHIPVSFFSKIFEATRELSLHVWFPCLSFSLLHDTLYGIFSAFLLLSHHLLTTRALSFFVIFAISGRRDSWNKTWLLIEREEVPCQHIQIAKRVLIAYLFSNLCVVYLRVLVPVNNLLF